MNLHIGDKILILDNPKQNRDIAQKGTIIDFKWNLALIRFEDGECDWIEIKKVYLHK